jgi:Trp operon repressor
MSNDEKSLPSKELQLAAASKAPVPVNSSSSRIDGKGNPDRKKLTVAQRRTLCRELAVGEVTRAALSRKYGVSRPAITQFAKRHAAEIKTIQEDLDNEFAAQWIAQKELRVEQYQRDLELSAEGPFANHYEQIRTRGMILRNVAEELGQLPTRGNVTVVPVTHVVVGVDVDDLT